MKWHSFDSFSHLWLDPLLFPFILYHQAWTLQLWGVCKRSIFIGGNGQQQQIDLNFQLHVSLKLWICFVAWSAAPPQLWSSSIGKLTWVTWPLSQSRTWLWDTKRSSLFSDSGFSWQWQATELILCHRMIINVSPWLAMTFGIYIFKFASDEPGS